METASSQAPVAATAAPHNFQEEGRYIQLVMEDNPGALQWLEQKTRGLRITLARSLTLHCPHLFDDALAEAWIGVLRAAKQFRPGHVRFTTYAHNYIVGAIQSLVAKQLHVVRRPRGRYRKAKALVSRHMWEDSETQEFQPAEEEALARALAFLSRDVSLQAGFQSEGDEEGCLEDLLACEDPLEEASEDDRMYFLIQAMKIALTPRQYQVLCLHYGLEGQEPITLEQISKVLSLTKERVRQIEFNTQKQLRKMIMEAESMKQLCLCPGWMQNDSDSPQAAIGKDERSGKVDVGLEAGPRRRGRPRKTEASQGSFNFMNKLGAAPLS